MDPFTSLYSDLVQPLGSGPVLAPMPGGNAPADNSGFSLTGFTSGLGSLFSTGVNAYRQYTGATGGSGTSPARTATGASSWSQYLPWILISGGVLLLLVIILRKK